MTLDYRIMYIRDKSNQRIGAMAINVDRKNKKINYQFSMVHPADAVSKRSFTKKSAVGLKITKTQTSKVPFNADIAQVIAAERLASHPYTVSMSKEANSHEITARVMEHIKTIPAPSRARKFAKMWLDVYNNKRLQTEEESKKAEIQKRKDEFLSCGAAHTVRDHRDGSKSYFFNGKRHRAIGPAVEYVDGRTEYWYNDMRFDSQKEVDEYVLTNEDRDDEETPALNDAPASNDDDELWQTISVGKNSIKKKLSKKKAAKKSSVKKKLKKVLSKKIKKQTTKKLAAKKPSGKKVMSNSKYISLLRKSLKMGPKRDLSDYVPVHLNHRSFK